MQRTAQLSTLTAEDHAFSRLAALSALLFPEMPPAAHHRLLCRKLEAVERGEIKRLMVFLPPGSAKSHYANVNFSAWYVGRNPRASLLVCSASSPLAEQWGRRVRNIVAAPLYQRIFGTGLAGDNAAADRWATWHGGQYYAAGVGANIVGRRADLAILDDPVADREHADSPTERERLWNWYKWDFWTRLKPGAAVILIMTRWHDNDLAGRLLTDAAAGGEPWDVLKLPALAEEGDALGRSVGEPLWPEWFTSSMFTEAQRNARSWSALYQQNPQPDSGTYFDRSWFRWFDPANPPASLNTYGASDFAVTEGAGDSTEHGVFGMDPADNLYLIDWWHGQTAADAWIEEWLNLMARHKPLAWFGESGPIRRAIEPFLVKRQRERRVYGRVEWIASIRDKPTRARSFQARAAMGKIYLPTGRPWAERLLDQLLRFPAGTADDAVDVCSLMGLALDMAHPATMPKPKNTAPRDAWDKAFRDDDGDSGWKVA